MWDASRFGWGWFTGAEMGLDVGVTFHLPDQRPLVLTTHCRL